MAKKDEIPFNFFEEFSEATSENTSKEEKDLDVSRFPVLDEKTEDSKEYFESESEEESEESPVEETQEEEEENSLLEVFANNLIEDGILTPRFNEDGEADYDDSEEGLKLMVEHTIEDKVKEFKEELNSLVIDKTLNVTLGDLAEFIKNGGDPKEFFNFTEQVIYEEIPLDDEDNQVNLIIDKFKLDGLEDEEIDELIEEYKISGSLAKQARIAQKVLAKHQKEEFENIKKAQEQERIKLEEEEKENSEKFKQRILSTSTIGGIEVSEKERSKFHEYLTKPVKKGKNGEYLTQYEIDTDENKRLEMAYVAFKGGISSIEKSTKSKVAKDLKLTLSKHKDTLLSKNSQSDQSTEREVKSSSKRVEIADLW